jgi:hypothetical protein
MINTSMKISPIFESFSTVLDKKIATQRAMRPKKERSEVGEPHCALGPISFKRLVETAAHPGKDLHRFGFTDGKNSNPEAGGSDG